MIANEKSMDKTQSVRMTDLPIDTEVLIVFECERGGAELRVNVTLDAVLPSGQPQFRDVCARVGRMEETVDGMAQPTLRFLPHGTLLRTFNAREVLWDLTVGQIINVNLVEAGIAGRSTEVLELYIKEPVTATADEYVAVGA